MRLYRDRAVVLRQHKLGEADRIVTLLTREHGLVRAVAKGVRRTRSKFGSRLEPFAHIDVQLHPGRNLDIVTQVQAIDAFATDIVSDYGRYTCACAVLETAERLAGEERAPAPALHRLTVGALRAVADGGRPWELVLDAYLLRAMGIAGWAPALTECARCAAPGPHRAFHVAAGGSVCVHCRPSGSATPPQGVLDLMVGAARRRLGARARRPRRRTAARPAVWWPRICSGTWNVSCAHCRWWSAFTGLIATVADTAARWSGRMWRMAMKRAGARRPPRSCLRRLRTIRPSRTRRRWPVVFPALPAARNGRFARPPQHTSKAVAPQIPADQVPNHVAVVMDGNGRWATQRGLRRTEGHKMGEAVLIDITCGAIELGIKHLTVYAFSTENWKRSTEEVRFLMGFNREVVRPAPGEPGRHGRPHALGRVAAPDVAQRHQGVRHRRADDGGQRRHHHQLLRELRRPYRDRRGGTGNRAGGRRGQDQPGPDHRGDLRQTSAPRGHPRRRSVHPDIGGAAGQQFLLWQSAYAEYVFQDKLWPDYDRRDLWAACEEYVSRNRRFGRA